MQMVTRPARFPCFLSRCTSGRSFHSQERVRARAPGSFLPPGRVRMRDEDESSGGRLRCSSGGMGIWLPDDGRCSPVSCLRKGLVYVRERVSTIISQVVGRRRAASQQRCSIRQTMGTKPARLAGTRDLQAATKVLSKSGTHSSQLVSCSRGRRVDSHRALWVRAKARYPSIYEC